RVRLAWADSGYQAHRLTAWATALRITLQIVRRPDDLHTFTVLPRRWVVERTFAWISKHRRTVRDYEHLPASHEAMILWAMIALMTRRLAQPTELSDAHLALAGTPNADSARDANSLGCCSRVRRSTILARHHPFRLWSG